MKILVTGGCGFIGSAVVRRAVADGHFAVNLDKLTYAANPANVAEVADSDRYAFVRACVTDGAALRAAFATHRPDAVMHLAAESHVDRSIHGPDDFMQTNAIGTFRMLEAAREHWNEGAVPGFRFLHVSTDEVYGALGADGAFTEESPYAPNSPYSASKAASDHLVRAWGKTYGLPVVVTNCSNNYGPFQYPEKLIPVAILKALAGEAIPIYGEGENVRDWLYVEDHAAALLKALCDGRTGETYNIGGGCEARNIDVARAVCRIVDDRRPEGAPRENRIAFVADRPGHDFRYAIDAGKIRRELGWTPSVALEEGLEKTVDWFLANEAWWRPLQNRPSAGAGNPA